MSATSQGNPYFLVHYQICLILFFFLTHRNVMLPDACMLHLQEISRLQLLFLNTTKAYSLKEHLQIS